MSDNSENTTQYHTKHLYVPQTEKQRKAELIEWFVYHTNRRTEKTYIYYYIESPY